MDELLLHLQTRKWKGTDNRPNIVPPSERKETRWSATRTLTKSRQRVLSEYHGTGGETYRLVTAVAPDIPEGWHLTVNKNVACFPHRDKYQTSNHILLLRSFDGGGQLCTEDGFSSCEKGVWHRIDPRRTHWVEPWESGDRYSIVLFYKPEWQLKRWEDIRKQHAKGCYESVTP